MNKIDTILWDVDGTLLDFEASEEISLRQCFKEYDVELSREQMEWYSECNRNYWRRLERGEIEKSRVYIGRFEDFFERFGIAQIDPKKFNDQYQMALGNSAVPREHGLELCRALKGRFRQYVVTNGSTVAQNGKLRNMGFYDLMDGLFISEEIGAEKPNKAFFDFCSQNIPDYDPHKTLIIGDSLTSDMAGGNNAGILCCWYNPKGAEIPEDLRIDYDIRSLFEVDAILGL